MQCMHRQRGLRESREGIRVYSGQATGGQRTFAAIRCQEASSRMGTDVRCMDSGPPGQEQSQPGDEETPPSAASTVGLMAVGGEHVNA